MKFRSLIYFIAFISISHLSIAQSDTIPEFITDRPDQTESPNSVPVGYFQVETGFQYEEFELSSFVFKNYTYNTTLLRYGLFKKFELRLGANLINLENEFLTPESDPATGFSPILFGAKYELIEENGWFPKFGVLGSVFIPVGGNYGSGELESELRLAFSHTLSEKSGLSYNLGFNLGKNVDTEFFYTLTYGYNVVDPLTLYAEVYATILDADFAHNWNAGLTYLLKNNLQLDGYIGTGINTNQNLLLGVGVSFRLPN